jgi:hypothetical protein
VTYRVTPAPRAPAPIKPGGTIDSSLFGNHALSADFPTDAATVRLWDTGTTWGAIETSPGTYDWSKLDARIGEAVAHQASVLLVLGGTPAWAGTLAPSGAPTEYAGVGSASPPRDPARFGSYVSAVATHVATTFPTATVDYQVWNEANIPNYWRGTPDQMADLTARARAAVKAAGSPSRVVAASTGTRWVRGYAGFFPAYLAALRVRKWPVDAFSAHLYPAEAGRADARLALLGMVRESLRAAGAPTSIPLWDTEVNYGANVNGAVPITGSDARTVVARTYLDSVRYGVSRVYWYGWTTTPILGVTMSTGSDAALAYSATRDWLDGGSWLGCTVTGGTTDCRVSDNGQQRHVVWAPTARQFATPAGATTVHRLDGTTAAAVGPVPVGPEPVMVD